MSSSITPPPAKLAALRRKIYYFEDWLFERRYGLQLGGIVANGDLITDSPSKPHATFYQAVECRSLRELLREARKTGFKFDYFVDIGSGKGKACFYAHTRQTFPKVLGIEFSKPLIAIAETNKRSFDRPSVIFLNADATQFKLPEANCLVFMYNPFDDVGLERFISCNLNHFQTHDSAIAYANDIRRMVLTRFGFETLYRNQTTKVSLYRYR
jgi:SAM-dependent methyltransferase